MNNNNSLNEINFRLNAFLASNSLTEDMTMKVKHIFKQLESDNATEHCVDFYKHQLTSMNAPTEIASLFNMSAQLKHELQQSQRPVHIHQVPAKVGKYQAKAKSVPVIALEKLLGLSHSQQLKLDNIENSIINNSKVTGDTEREALFIINKLGQDAYRTAHAVAFYVKKLVQMDVPIDECDMRFITN